MKKLAVAVMIVSLTGCASVMEMIPSRWDVNQAKSITDIQMQARHFDCAGDQKTQIDMLSANVEWFTTYSQTKPTRDISKLVGTLTTTVKEYQDRLKTGPVSPMYCDLKKKLFVQQADILAGSVQGRF